MHIKRITILLCLCCLVFVAGSEILPAAKINANAATLTLTANQKKGYSLYQTGVSLNKKKDFSKALYYLAQADKLLSNNANVHYQLGISYEGLKKYVLAARQYREAVRLNPKLQAAKDAAGRFEKGPKLVLFTADY